MSPAEAAWLGLGVFAAFGIGIAIVAGLLGRAAEAELEAFERFCDDVREGRLPPPGESAS